MASPSMKAPVDGFCPRLPSTDFVWPRMLSLRFFNSFATSSTSLFRLVIVFPSVPRNSFKIVITLSIASSVAWSRLLNFINCHNPESVVWVTASSWFKCFDCCACSIINWLEGGLSRIFNLSSSSWTFCSRFSCLFCKLIKNVTKV